MRCFEGLAAFGDLNHADGSIATEHGDSAFGEEQGVLAGATVQIENTIARAERFFQ